jgi:VWFA-related protein
MMRRPPTPSIAPAVALAAVVAAGGAAAAVGSARNELQVPGAVFRDSVSVDLLTVDLRVLDARGRPIEDLTASDLRVRYRGEELPVVALEWSAGGGNGFGEGGSGRGAEPSTATAARPGRVVFWLQPGLQAVRIKGHLQLLPELQRLLRELPPGELVAVLSFDSRLKLWQDFTPDRALAWGAIANAIRFGAAPPQVAKLAGGLSAYLDGSRARRAATPERAMTVTAEALGELPGDKVLVLVGWGFGRWGSSGFRMTPEYRKTLRALDAARASVFVLDVTDADYHTLELGLRQVARNTGGSYAKTNLFPTQAVGHLAGALAGRYRLTVDRSTARAARPRDLRIELLGRSGRILAADR